MRRDERVAMLCGRLILDHDCTREEAILWSELIVAACERMVFQEEAEQGLAGLPVVEKP